MKNRWIWMVVVGMVWSFSATAVASDGRLTIDSERSTLSWTSDAPQERIVGTAEEIEGAVSWDLNNLEATSGAIQFPVSSMKSGNRLRDRHLQGRDWLNARANPDIIYTIERLEVVSRSQEGDRIDVEVKVFGKVTINGVESSNEATANLAILPETNRVRIQTTLEVTLRDHEISGRRGSIGSEVGESIEIEATLYGSW